MLARVRTYASFVRFSHSVFALPFALTGAILASRLAAPRAVRLVWVVVCMVAARSAAMGFNRLADAAYDARNPRTAMRELPRGAMSARDESSAFVPAARWNERTPFRRPQRVRSSRRRRFGGRRLRWIRLRARRSRFPDRLRPRCRRQGRRRGSCRFRQPRRPSRLRHRRSRLRRRMAAGGRRWDSCRREIRRRRLSRSEFRYPDPPPFAPRRSTRVACRLGSRRVEARTGHAAVAHRPQAT